MMRDDQLIFMISMPRSGSTMIQRILGRHPAIYTRSEPWLMLHPLHAFKSDNLHAGYDSRLAQVGLEDFLNGLGKNTHKTYYDGVKKLHLSLYGKYLEKHSKEYFLDKTPRYYEIYDELKTTFPNARFLLLYRNPLAVFSSILNTWVKNELTLLKTYKRDLEVAPSFLSRDFSNDPRAIKIKYEDLLKDPSGAVNGIFNALGIPTSESCIEYGSGESVSWRLGDQKTVNMKSTPDAEHANTWEQKLSDPVVHSLSRDYLDILGPDTVSALGYNFDELRNTLESRPPNRKPARPINALRQYLDTPSEEVLKAQGELHKATTTIESLGRELHLRNKRIDQKQHRLNQLHNHIEELQKLNQLKAHRISLLEEAIQETRICADLQRNSLLDTQQKLSVISELLHPLDTLTSGDFVKQPLVKISAYKKLISIYRRLQTQDEKQSNKIMSNSAPKIQISVITVNLNSGDLLEKTILSVIAQDCESIEHIVIDGDSNDESSKAIERYRHHLSCIISEPDKGIYDAMNKGIACASGTWTLFLNAGDEFAAPSTAENLLRELDPNFQFIFGDRYRVNESGNVTRERAGPIDDTLIREVIFHQSLLTKTDLLKSRPYNTTYKLASDFEYIVHAWSSGYRFKKLSYPVSRFLSGGASRQKHLLAKLEAAHVIASWHNGDRSLSRHNSFFQSLMQANIGFSINAHIQKLKRENENFELHISLTDNNLQIASSHSEGSKDSLFSGISEGLSAVPIRFINSPQHTDKHIEKPLFSIVTVTFNAKTLLEETLESLGKQSCRNFEHIVIDGASTDGTVDIIKMHNTSITRWISEPDSGIYDAMNKGIDLARGRWINFMNAGDKFSSPDVLDSIASLIENDPDVIYGDRYYLKGSSRVLQKSRAVETIFEKMPFGHQSTFIKSSTIKKQPFNDTYKFAADYDMFMRLFKQGRKFQQVDLAICDFLSGGKSESGLRPYLEAMKILLDNTNDIDVISKNTYFHAFKKIKDELLANPTGA